MSAFQLRFLGDPILKTPALDDVGGPEDLPPGLLPAMRRVLEEQKGLGLAAQQVGSTARVALMKLNGQVVEAINLKVLEYSPEKILSRREGCLSVQGKGRYFRTNVSRHAWVWVSYRDTAWQEHTLRLDGMAAILAQHEADHLDGRCIVDGLPRQQRRLAERIVGRRP